MSDSGHPSDQDLALASAGELPRDRMAEIEAHLAACSRCRSNVREFEEILGEYVSLRQASLDAQLPPIERARADLKRRLAAAGPMASLTRLMGQSGWHLVARLASIAVIAGILVVAWRGRQPSEVRARFIPDARLTPGLAVEVSASQLCSSNAVDPAPIGRLLAREVFLLHGITEPRPRAYELDYLIPAELGGSSDVRNLWPQPYGVDPWNAHAKDALEDYLLDLVCDGEIELATAQLAIARDWTAAYRRYFRVDQPLVEHASFLKDEPWE